jgi:hypothetical protein
MIMKKPMAVTTIGTGWDLMAGVPKLACPPRAVDAGTSTLLYFIASLRCWPARCDYLVLMAELSAFALVLREPSRVFVCW